MKKIMLPAVALMNQLTYNYKFILISVLWLLPIIGVSYLLLNQLNQSINQIKNEIIGIHAYENIYETSLTAKSTRDIRSNAKQRDSQLLNQRSSNITDTLSKSIDSLASNVELNAINNEVFLSQLEAIKQEWQKTLGEETVSVDFFAQYRYYKSFTDKIDSLLTSATQASGLSQDVSAEIQDLLKLSSSNLLETIETISYVRSLGVYALNQGSLDYVTSDALNAAHDKLGSLSIQLDPALQMIGSNESYQLDASLLSLSSNSINAVQSLMDEHLLNPIRLETKWNNYESDINEHIKTLSTLNKEIIDQITQILTIRLDEETRARTALVTILVTVLVIIFYLYVGFSMSVRSSIFHFSEAARKISSGDLTVRLRKRSNDELGELTDAFNDMTTKVHQLIKTVSNTVLSVSEHAGKVNLAADANSQAMIRQVEETHQISSAMSQMVLTVNEVSESTQSTADAASAADKEAEKGQHVVDETLQAIEHLSAEIAHSVEMINRVKKDSDDISNVLIEIKGIAEQTNLLALNAAIEAARAGDQGRGFAVVSDEVRTLAQRTQNSTEEIDATIDRLQKGVERAVYSMHSSHSTTEVTVDQSKKVAEALKMITSSVTTIVNMGHQISSAAEQQSAMAENIDQNVQEIIGLGKETERNAQETLNTSNELLTNTDSLRQLINTFKI